MKKSFFEGCTKMPAINRIRITPLVWLCYIIVILRGLYINFSKLAFAMASLLQVTCNFE
jgi:hypothetical protein